MISEQTSTEQHLVIVLCRGMHTYSRKCSCH